MVFRRTREPVDLRRLEQWWVWTPGACWRHPEGPGSSVTDRGEHPAVHIAFADARAYARWAGATLPSVHIPRKVAKGGSFLCADSYCACYRSAARRPQMIDTGMSHIGFRCIRPAGESTLRG